MPSLGGSFHDSETARRINSPVSVSALIRRVPIAATRPATAGLVAAIISVWRLACPEPIEGIRALRDIRGQGLLPALTHYRAAHNPIPATFPITC